MGVSTLIVINIDKAKSISHDIRRKARDKEFIFYDNIISKQIPGQSAIEAEAQRQLIRDKYALMQVNIDKATTDTELKNILGI